MRNNIIENGILARHTTKVHEIDKILGYFQGQFIWIRSTRTLKAWRKKEETQIWRKCCKTLISWSNDYELASADTHWKAEEAGFLTQFTDLNLELQTGRYDQNTKPISGKMQIPMKKNAGRTTWEEAI